MSLFEDYNTTCNSYDGERRPIGADVVAGMIHVHGKKSINDIHLLDAGCGTGNYAKALIGYGVGKITLMDASSGMLSQARAKLADAIADNTVVNVIENKLPEIPFEDGTFDVVLFSLVLHHLSPCTGNEQSRKFQDLERALTQARRVLRRDGVLIIIAQSEDDIKNTWYCQINMDITAKYTKNFAPVRKYLEIFERTGFNCIQKLRLMGTLLEGHLNLEGPLQKSWRDCDSYWSLATENDLNNVRQKLHSLNERGELKDWVAKHDRVKTNGIATMYVCN